MLCLKIKKTERVIIDSGKIVVTIIDIDRGYVRLGFTAPPEISINREVIQQRIDAGEPKPIKSNPPAITATDWFRPAPSTEERKSQ